MADAAVVDVAAAAVVVGGTVDRQEGRGERPEQPRPERAPQQRAEVAPKATEPQPYRERANRETSDTDGSHLPSFI
jgi:hypothetical protein